MDINELSGSEGLELEDEFLDSCKGNPEFEGHLKVEYRHVSNKHILENVNFNPPFCRQLFFQPPTT
ncbi:hypothetical protein CDAR_596161 [Caerostris darwini]|uniref:Uncharacterized protein n=1 Tax=Caerostris darwini TaxID=1538125 RepID=A0AAV4UXU0_9ARAC|nr:hypothetical protein CDAR_596161 [Caerostris darwini]